MWLEAPYKNGKKEGLGKMYYYPNGKLEIEIMFVNGEPVYGYLYGLDGQKTEMNNAQLHNYRKDLPLPQ